MSVKSPRVPPKAKEAKEAVNGSDQDGWNVVAKTSEFFQKLTKMSSDIPDQLKTMPAEVQHSLITLYMTINNSMLTALDKAEDVLNSAQDKARNAKLSPHLDTALEKLKLASTELNNSLKRVGQMLQDMEKDVTNSKGNSGKSETKKEENKSTSRFSFKRK